MKKILAEIVPQLRALGFKGSGQNYRKETVDAVMVINFQKSVGGNRFYVNLGVQLLFIPAVGGGNVDPKQIKEYQCVFRRRVSPPDGLAGWPYDITAEMVTQLGSRITAAYEEYLSPLSEVPGAVTQLTPEQFQAQTADSIFGGKHPRNALLFARIALAGCAFSRAKAFAQMGLAQCPPRATSLMANLQNILKEITERR